MLRAYILGVTEVDLERFSSYHGPYLGKRRLVSATVEFCHPTA